MKRSLLDFAGIRRWLDGKGVLVQGPAGPPRVALTFDDGPHPIHTPRLLRILESHGIPATFFLSGSRARRHPAIVGAIAAAGHQVGTHGHHHFPWTLRPWLRRDLEASITAITDAGAPRPTVARPPFGWLDDRVLRICAELGLRVALGDVYVRDTTRPGTLEIVRRVERRVVPGSVIILHDGGWRDGVDREQTLSALEDLVPRIRQRGWGFARLDDWAPARR